MTEVCADADWLPKDKKDALRKIALEGVEEESLILTEETRIPVGFRPCPDCGCGKYPYFHRSYICRDSKPLYVKAYCSCCNWETNYYSTVKECAKEWNEAEV